MFARLQQNAFELARALRIVKCARILIIEKTQFTAFWPLLNWRTCVWRANTT